MGKGLKATEQHKGRGPFDLQAFLTIPGVGRTVTQCERGHRIFSQGDPSDAVFYLQKGMVMLTVKCRRGKEAVIGIRTTHSFFGDGCIGGQTVRAATASAITPCSVLRIETNEMLRMLHEWPALSDLFISFQVSRNLGMQEDLADQLFNSSEKRLARALLLLDHHGTDDEPDDVPDVNEEMLARMVGTTRSRISYFMNRFKKLGFVAYRGDLRGGLRVHDSLLRKFLQD